MAAKPTIHIGPPVWGTDFYNREKEIKDCWEHLSRSSMILSAPRRYGKSSLMLHLQKQPIDEFFPIYFQLEDHFNLNGFTYEFVSKILEYDDSLASQVKQWFSKIFKSLEELSVLEFKIKLKKAIEDENDWETWKERIKELISRLLETKNPQKVLFILDEFPLLLSNFISEGEEGEKEAVKVLQWLRKLRHDSPFSDGVRFILGGSIGIEKVVGYLQATRTINDIGSVIIGAFEGPTAENFIKDLFQSKELTPTAEVIAEIIEVVGTLIPIYLQILSDSVIKEHLNTGKEITPELVRWCYQRRVHGPEYKRYFEDYYERLHRYYPEESRCAKQMLRELANAGEGVPTDRLQAIYRKIMKKKGDTEKFELLLSALESDFYIRRDPTDGRVYFQNKWLKDWWRVYHGLS